ncbi:hypothetical protein ACPYPG_02265 [Streptomyces sp. FR-108]|uniref:hypothetical protein n=1 Tax=Streptomyces sp. FR-108 TaxID=3416665 RepID=UPI003CF2A7C4
MAGGADDEKAQQAADVVHALKVAAGDLRDRMRTTPEDELDASDVSRMLIARQLGLAQKLLSGGPGGVRRIIGDYQAKPYWKVKELPTVLNLVAAELCNAYGIHPGRSGRDGRAAPLEGPVRPMVSENLPERSPEPGPAQ